MRRSSQPAAGLRRIAAARRTAKPVPIPPEFAAADDAARIRIAPSPAAPGARSQPPPPGYGCETVRRARGTAVTPTPPHTRTTATKTGSDALVMVPEQFTRPRDFLTP